MGDRLTEIKAREAAATKGPWRGVKDGIVSEAVLARAEAAGESFDPDIVVTDCGYYPPRYADAAFIAHAREDVPWLVAEVERLRAELAAKEAP